MAAAARPAFPRYPLYGMIGMAIAALIAAFVGQTWDIGTVRTQLGDPAAIRDIAFRQEGEILIVADAHTGAILAELPESEPGFVHGLVRGLERARLPRHIAPATPYRLIGWSSGAVTLADTGSGERIYLGAYGRDNAATMAAFLEMRR